jgi:hypothetical protein
MTQTAVYGDDDNAVRAGTQLAKMAGWNKPDVDAPKPVTVNLYTLIGENQQVSQRVQATVTDTQEDREGFLAHEPGGPVRISCDDVAVNE